MKKSVLALILVTIMLISTSCGTQTTNNDPVSNNGEEKTNVVTTEATTTQDPSLKLIAPSEDYVITCLKTVGDITDIEAATESHDPNNGLNKQGKYIAAVYFRTSSLSLVEDNGYKYLENSNGNRKMITLDEDEDFNSPVDVGTDGGGQIEVYRTAEDAEARDQYLASFDSTAFASGSHIVVGSMVIRTSNYLTGTQQQELTNAIVDALEKG